MLFHSTMHTAPLLLAAALPTVGRPESSALKTQSTTVLEKRIEQIDAELAQLAQLSLRVGVGSLGYYMVPAKQAPAWVEIELEHTVPIDQIVLAPILWRDEHKGFLADGFPAEFRIRAGTADDRQGTLIGEYRSDDGILPRIAPWIAPVDGITASWVRIEISRFTRRSLTKGFRFQLSEIMVFSGEENVALKRPVRSSSNSDHPPVWQKQNLTDGHTPYIMDAARGGSSAAYYHHRASNPVFTIDLGETLALSRIHLHPMDQSDTIPMSFRADFALPEHLIFEGATRSDFSDAKLLLDIQRESEFELGPIMMWPIAATPARYVRLSTPKHHEKIPVGFTEIELFSGGRNVARGKTVNSSIGHETGLRKLSAITDGLNSFGEILPVRTWMNQLARRHDLEIERPRIEQELNLRYARQKANLNRLSWLAALLAAGIGFTILIDRFIRLQQLTRVRERFAADLHDELGAHIHTINLLGELAINQAENLPEDVVKLISGIRTVTAESNQAIRHLIHMQKSKELGSGLQHEMQQAAERMAIEQENRITVEGKEFLPALNPRTRIDLLLFYKECLVNICRHSEATRLDTRLSLNGKNLTLIIRDNGRGVPDGLSQGVPPSLKRRAKLLRARLQVETPAEGGTRIILNLRTRKFGRKKQDR